MGSGGVAIAALPTVICLKVPFSDGLGGGIFAWVSVNNSASMRCFEKAGYKQTDISEERNLALFEEPQLFYKWIMVSK